MHFAQAISLHCHFVFLGPKEGDEGRKQRDRIDETTIRASTRTSFLAAAKPTAQGTESVVLLVVGATTFILLS